MQYRDLGLRDEWVVIVLLGLVGERMGLWGMCGCGVSFLKIFFVLSRCHVKGRVLMYFLQESTVVIGKNMVGL